jgi:hypothetical protein
MTDAERARLAAHEAGHAVAAVAFGLPLRAVSLRAGKLHAAVTLIDRGPGSPEYQPRDRTAWAGTVDRDAREREIIVTLAGELAEPYREPVSGYFGPSDDEAAARAALEDLERRSPRAAELVLAAEANDEVGNDRTRAHDLSWALHGFEERVVDLHLAYLEALARVIVGWHRWHIAGLAHALVERTVIDGPEAEAIIRSYRCICHPAWGQPAAPATGTPE